jgi:hypothetical protein
VAPARAANKRANALMSHMGAADSRYPTCVSYCGAWSDLLRVCLSHCKPSIANLFVGVSPPEASKARPKLRWMTHCG